MVETHAQDGLKEQSKPKARKPLQDGLGHDKNIWGNEDENSAHVLPVTTSYTHQNWTHGQKVSCCDS